MWFETAVSVFFDGLISECLLRYELIPYFGNEDFVSVQSALKASCRHCSALNPPTRQQQQHGIDFALCCATNSPRMLDRSEWSSHNMAITHEGAAQLHNADALESSLLKDYSICFADFSDRMDDFCWQVQYMSVRLLNINHCHQTTPPSN